MYAKTNRIKDTKQKLKNTAMEFMGALMPLSSSKSLKYTKMHFIKQNKSKDSKI